MKLIGKLICWWKKGHKRGKPRLASWDGKPLQQGGYFVFFCPRCERETRYKVRPGAVE